MLVRNQAGGGQLGGQAEGLVAELLLLHRSLHELRENLNVVPLVETLWIGGICHLWLPVGLRKVHVAIDSVSQVRTRSDWREQGWLTADIVKKLVHLIGRVGKIADIHAVDCVSCDRCLWQASASFVLATSPLLPLHSLYNFTSPFYLLKLKLQTGHLAWLLLVTFGGSDLLRARGGIDLSIAIEVQLLVNTLLLGEWEELCVQLTWALRAISSASLLLLVGVLRLYARVSQAILMLQWQREACWLLIETIH